MSNELKRMSPGEILKAIRDRDQGMIRILIRDGLNRKIWTMTEVAEMLDVDLSTVSKWMKHAKK